MTLAPHHTVGGCQPKVPCETAVTKQSVLPKSVCQVHMQYATNEYISLDYCKLIVMIEFAYIVKMLWCLGVITIDMYRCK